MSSIEEKVDKYMRLRYTVDEEIGGENLPKGGTKKSLQKFARSLTGKTKNDPEGFGTECFNRIKDEEGFDEESAKRFCAALKDEYLGTTKGRGKDKDEE